MNRKVRKVFTSRYLLIPIALLVLYGLAGFFAVPEVLRRYLPRYAEQQLGCQATIGEIRFNPFLLTVEILRFSLRQATGSPLLSFDRLFVDLEAAGLLRQTVVVRRADLDRPAIHVVIEPDGSTSLARITGLGQRADPAVESASEPIPVELLDAAVREGRISVSAPRQHDTAELILDRIDVEVRDLSTAGKGEGAFRLAAAMDAGESVTWEGRLAFSPLRSEGTFTCESIRAALLWEFFRNSFNLEKPAGRFDFSAGYSYRAGDDPLQLIVLDAHLAATGLEFNRSGRVPFRAKIASGDMRLQASMELGDEGTGIVFRDLAGELRGIRLATDLSPEPPLAVDKVSLQGGGFDLAGRTIFLDRIALSGGGVDVVRDAAGAVNWLQLLQRNETVGRSGRHIPTDATVDAPWNYRVGSVEVDGFRTRFTDLTTASEQPVISLQEINARMADIDGVAPVDFSAGFQVEQGGTVKLEGTLTPTGPSLEADIDVQEMTLTALQRYLEPHIALEMQSASGSARGRLRYGLPDEKHRVVYEGSLNINRLRFADPVSKKLYLGAETISTPRIRAAMQPDRLDVGTVRLSRPFGELIIGEDGTLNFSRIIKGKKADGQLPQPGRPVAGDNRPSDKGEGFAYRISRVDVEDGDLVFADLSLPSQFKTRIHDLRGSVTGIASDRGAQARIRLAGQVDRYGVAKISGGIRPGNFRDYSDISLVFRNLEMKNLSPYSGKFAGRLIDSGKISADLKYTIQDSKMTGDNRLIIDKLVLGERVEHRDAAGLSLDLALALLRDANGRIDIGLPVTGDLSDPTFDAGALTRKLIANLITKTVTAPFQVLSMVLGGTSQRLDMLEFVPGRDGLSPPEQEKLLELARALHNRPQLRLVIQGRYSPQKDGRELKRRAVRRIVADRLQETPGDEQRPGSLDFADPDTQEVMEDLYEERFGKESLVAIRGTFAMTAGVASGVAAGQAEGETRTADTTQITATNDAAPGIGQDVRWARELFDRLVDSEAVAEETLLQLADGRAQSVATGLAADGNIARERLAIRKPEAQDGQGKPSVRLFLEAM